MTAFFSEIGSFFTSVILVVSYLLGIGSVGCSDNYELVKQDKVIMLEALCCGQGMCTDGEFLYSSSAITALNLTIIAKWDMDMNLLDRNVLAVPSQLTKTYGSNHIGGIDCYDGIIYAPVENDDYSRNFIVLYDCDTLEYTGKYYNLTSEYLTDGIPWCAVDGENGYLYTSKYSDVTEILQYNLSDMSFVKTLKLNKKLDRIQGGSVYNGMLYLSTDVPHSVNEEVFAADIRTGEVKTELTRNLNNYDNEAEDIFVYPFEDGSLIHVIDYDKLLGVNIYHYKAV
ncbi:MAG: hypothetical protein MJ168_07055 [Clostridia bacterium]|nr:hypothetical protein [Clostridia bacterium]